MPYKKGDTPEALRGKNIPRRFIDQFIEVFNAVLKKDGDEESAFAQAHGVMTKALLRAGYRQGRDKKWHKVSKREAQEETFVPVPGTRAVVVEATDREKALDEGLRFTGVALTDYAVSQQGTGFERYYSKEFNDLCLERTKEYVAQGHTVTIYNTHGAAFGDMWTGPVKNPIGKMEDIWRDGEDILYRGFISATGEGQDVIRLMLDGIRNETSVRIYEPSAEQRRLEDQEEREYPDYLTVMLDGYIGGIDFCDEAGIPGAGLVQILESAPRFHTQEDTMLTLETLKAEHPDLVSAIVEEKLGVLSELVAGLQEEKTRLATQLAAVEAQAPDTAALQAKIDALEALVAEQEKALQLERAAQGPLQREIVAALKAEQPEDPAARALALRDEMLSRLQAEYLVTKDTAKGVVTFVDEDRPEPTPVADETEELMAKIARFSAKGRQR